VKTKGPKGSRSGAFEQRSDGHDQVVAETTTSIDDAISRRKLLAWAGALSLGSPLLAACGSSGSKTTGGTVKSVTSGTVRWMIEGGYKPSVDKVVAGLEQSRSLHLNVTVDAVNSETLPATWRTTVIRNKECDLLDGKNGKFLFLDPMLRNKVLQPLDAYYDLYGWDRYLSQSAVKHTTRDGKRWMVPLFVELPGISYRPSQLAKLGMNEPPSTWDEFRALLRDAKKAGSIPLTVGIRGFSFLMLLQNMFWSSADAGSIADVIFGDGKWTDGPAEEAAAAIQQLWTEGLIDPDALSIDIAAAAQRFLTGKATMNVTGTWFFATMQQTFGGDDWNLFTPPSPSGGPMWSLGEDQAMVIPVTSRDPNAAGALLDYLVRGDGARTYVRAGNVMATNAAASLQPPQVRALPTGVKDKPAVYLYGWLPANSGPAWQSGIADVLTKKKTPKQWAQSVQAAWERDLAQGNLPDDRAQLL
jgi:raffinose/stachyose/melibiose transport system substrate-binding protein